MSLKEYENRAGRFSVRYYAGCPSVRLTEHNRYPSHSDDATVLAHLTHEEVRDLHFMLGRVIATMESA